MKKPNRLISILLPFIALIIFACICSGTDSQQPKEQNLPNSPTEDQAGNQEPMDVLGKVGNDVVIKDMRWKILEVKDLGNTLKSDNEFTEDLTTSGKFIMVRFEYENQSKDMKSLSTINIIDSEGREYTPASNAIYFIPEKEYLLFENINPGIVKTATVIFDVAPNASGLKFRVSDLELFSNAVGYIDLGL